MTKGALLPEALAAWQWWNFSSCALAPPEKIALTINMDETAICLFQGGAKGNLFVKKNSQAPERASLGLRRTYLTHVAMICNNADVQAHLPQVIIGNEHTLPARRLSALQAACPPNVKLLRQKSSWNNHEVCARIVRALGKALGPFKGRFHPILLFDSARVHLTVDVFKACCDAGVLPVVVPAQTTWLLQPLDTDAFKPYKMVLKKAFLEARAQTTEGSLCIEEMLRCIMVAIREVLAAQQWGTAFERVGFSYSQVGLGKRVQEHLGIDAEISVPTTRPTEEQLMLCFPKRAKIPWRYLWPQSSSDRPSGVGPRLASSRVSAGAITTARRMVTRSMSALSPMATASSSSSSAPSAAPPSSHVDAPGSKVHMTRSRTRWGLRSPR